MRQKQDIMGMPITIEIIDTMATEALLTKVFDYFRYIDQTFSTYKDDSVISAINKGLLKTEDAPKEVQEVLILCEQTKKETMGYFDITTVKGIDPSGLVKGWSIWKASQILDAQGIANYYIDAGGDIQVKGYNSRKEKWHIGIRNPFAPQEIIKVVGLHNQGIATSGNYLRGNHVYDPFTQKGVDSIASLSIIGPNVYEADRFATAAFAMGKEGITFLSKKMDLASYMIDDKGIATFTSNFAHYTLS